MGGGGGGGGLDKESNLIFLFVGWAFALVICMKSLYKIRS